MILILATKHQRKVSFCFLLLFYMELGAHNIKSAFAEPVPFHTPKRIQKLFNEESKKGTFPFIPATKESLNNVDKAIDGDPNTAFSPLIAGPGQPEMTSFQSVNSNDMVDLFSGDFSYNIPLMDVGGYPINIHYSGGVSMDQEASWVGLGWNINPGTISRSVRGMPDDFNGTDTIEKTQSIKENQTAGVTVGADFELGGLPLNKNGGLANSEDSSKLNSNPKVTLGASLGVFRNTYSGWGTEFGVNASISAGGKGFGDLTGSLGLNSSTQSGVTVSPSLSYGLNKADNEDNGKISFGIHTGFNTRSGISALQLNTNIRLERKFEDNTKKLSASMSHPIGVISFAKPSYTPSIGMPYTSTSFTFRGKIGTTAWAAHPSAFVEGYVSKQKIKDEDKIQRKPAVGYLHFSKSNDNTNTLLDFNRDKDVSYVPNKTPNIAIPQFTYDVYSISGEGTGGMFRPYRGDLGFVRDPYMKTRSGSDKLSVDLGFGYIFHGGVDFAFTTSFSENIPWIAQNDLAPHLKFREADTTFEPVYFRNPGEKTSNSQAYYNSIGDDQLIRVRLTGKKGEVRAGSSFMKFKDHNYTGEVNVNSPVVKSNRDKRTQVISYLNASEASAFGLDRNILSYKENSIPGISCNDTATRIDRVDDAVRKKHHLSQITVLNGDGRRYIYGIPAYNFQQQDVTFSVDKENNPSNLDKGLAQYSEGLDNSVQNDKGKESYFSREVTPAHAHSFLLTSIVSPDYVDLKNDGVTEDDMGDGINFNYTRVFGEEGNRFKWRTPSESGKGNYNEGLKSYSRDDKVTYMYGEKEVWYLNSVESKTMIAVFQLVNDRKDVYSVQGENGGIDTARKMRRLKQIDLYVKADLVSKGIKARPIKTVHFEYDYSLCKGVAGDPGTGKLTLRSIWFSYNGNEKGKLNPYSFDYHSFNPNYNPKHYDRWGSYKDPATNPKTGLANADFPYSEQDSINAAKYASAWMLNGISLPSGGRIKITYEGDDYAYVQNKRATQFFKIMGLASGPLLPVSNKLYEFPAGDKEFVIVKSSAPLHSKSDVHEKFLKGNDWFYFKLAVNVPSDTWGGGIEYIPVYAEVEDWGLVNVNRFWIKLKKVDGKSPLTRSALEFLRLNLPSKAYPNSEPGVDMNVWDVVKLMGNSMANLVTATLNYETKARTSGFCQVIDTSQSFIRLNNPVMKKRGGGYRVKRIEIYDNWKSMTGQKESVYGQEYRYTTTERIDGKDIVASSGVASYEPMIGAEENPFRTPVPYAERIAPGAPVNHLYTELPLGESYFPSASIGYRKVRVRTINAKAKSVNGWQETEYYTTKDFPTIVENTIINEDAKEMFRPKLENFLRINSRNFVTLSQGFKVELNDMNGKVKAQSSYAEKDSIKPINFVRNFYKVDNDTSHQLHLNNTVWTVDSLNGKVNKNGIVGKDIEVMIDLREQYSKTVSGDYGINVDYAQAGPFPWILPSSIPMPQMEQVRYRSFATVKIVQRYGILDSVVAMDKGSVVSTKNLLYDGETGEVVLSRTNNEFRDAIYNFSYPAHWAYSGMGMAYQNTDAVFKNLKIIKGILYYGGQSTAPFPVERFFESGDELLLTATLRSVQGGANCLQFNIDSLHLPKPKTVPMKAWVMDASKGKEGDRGLYFIDGEGNPLTVEANYMRILRSGHRNLLDASVGSIVMMANPVKDLGESGVRLVFDTTSKVINTSAVTYKDVWKTERFIYPRDTVYKVYHNYTKTLSPTEVVNKQFNTRHQSSSTRMEATNVIAAYDYETGSGGCKKAMYTKSLLNFDLSNIPSDAIVLSATMSFNGRKPRDMGPRQQLCGNWSFNWASVDDYYEGLDSSFLRRVLSGWNASTPYYNVQSTTQNQVKFSSTIYNTVSCTDLIQDIIDNENYGLSFEIGNTNHNEHKINFVSFCASAESNINCRSSNDNHDAMTCDCTAPELIIHYKSLDDSIANRCRTLGEDSVINPYRVGLAGNWRVDRAYTFYGDRVESNASSASTNIRAEGRLKDFSTFWGFTDSVLLPQPDTTKWVWNSASSLYSKKGFEIENYDPLGRYNAGLYGYNGTLPVAVAQNSRYREMMYDGFEDYHYRSEVCSLCETPREIDFAKNSAGVWVTDTISHSGLYSLKINAGAEANITVPLYLNDTSIGFSSAIDTSVSFTTVYHATGNGLEYFPNGNSSIANNPCPSLPGNYTQANETLPSNIDFNWGSSSAGANICADWFQARWTGLIQVPFTDNYTFYGDADGGFQVLINGDNVVEVLPSSTMARGKTIHLQAGQLYPIVAQYNHYTGSNAHVKLKWSRSMQPGIIEVVPVEYLYNKRFGVDTLSYSLNVPVNCVSTGSVKPHNFIRPNFSPVPGSQVVMSAWVRMDGNDCNTAPTLDSVIKITKHLSSSVDSDVYLKKTGVRIEGWQRYEAVTTLQNTEEISITIIAPNNRNVFVDDVRFQPFNSAMKSYAYNSVNLRLMAELDENNYTTFYEYDDDGTLIRVKKETERGIMTIKESRSALLKK